MKIAKMTPSRPSITRGMTPTSRPRVERARNLGSKSPVHNGRTGGSRNIGKTVGCSTCK